MLNMNGIRRCLRQNLNTRPWRTEMIHEVERDILLSKAQVITHGVAPNDPMNQGPGAGAA